MTLGLGVGRKQATATPIVVSFDNLVKGCSINLGELVAESVVTGPHDAVLCEPFSVINTRSLAGPYECCAEAH
jgi:hypothetical protein